MSDSINAISSSDPLTINFIKDNQKIAEKGNLVSLRNQITAEISSLKENQSMLKMFIELMQKIKVCVDKDDGIDWVNNEELKHYRLKGIEFLDEAKKLEQQAKDLEKKDLNEAHNVQKKAMMLSTMAKAMGAECESKFTREQKEKFLQDLHATGEELNASLQLQIQRLHLLLNEKHKSVIKI